MRILPLVAVMFLLLSCGSDSESGSSDSGVVDVVEGPFSVTIEPATPTSRDAFRAVSSSSGTSFRWMRDGTEVLELVEVSSKETTRGERWTVTATRDSDGRQAEASVTIRNAAPRCAQAVLSAVESGWPSAVRCACADRDEPDASDPIQDSCDILVGDQTFDTCEVDASELRRDDSVTCTLTPSDGFDTGPLAMSSSITVGNGAPHGGSVSITPNIATEGDSLTCEASGAGDPDSDVVTWSYEWFVDSTSVAPGQSIDGGVFDKNDVVHCVATPSDGLESGPSVQSESVTIANSVPSLAIAAISPTAGTRLTVFECPVSGLADLDPADTPTATIEWVVDGLPVASAPTFEASALAVGGSLSCRATPTDGEATGSAVDSSQALISNLPPVLESITVTPAAPNHASTLSCDTSALDPELDLVTVSWRWRRNGSLLTGQFGQTLTQVFSAGDSIVCEALCADPYTTTNWQASEPVVIANLAPVVGAVSVQPSTSGPCGTLTCAGPTPVDPEGQTVLVETVWIVDDADPVIAVTLNTPTPGSVVECEVTASDPAGVSTTATSAPFTVLNVPPTLSSAVVQPAAPTVGDQLTCQGAGYSDPDCGATPTYLAIWTFDPPLDPVEALTLDTGSLAAGTTVTCSLTASDGFDDSAAQSNAVTLAAPPLEAPTVTLSAPSGSSGPISCVPDSPAPGATIRWHVGANAPFDGPATLDPSPAADCDIVTCQYTLPEGAKSNVAQLSFPFGPDCDDGNVCTQSGCHPSGGCEATPVSAACDDGEVCTLNDTCSNGECAGTPNACDDGNPCTEAVCAPGIGCSSGFKAGPCSDGSVCTTDDACSNGSCAPGSALVCDDSDPCTLDSCDPVAGCIASPDSGDACDDDNPCTSGGTCSSGECLGTPIDGKPSCGSNNYCADGVCHVNLPPSAPTVSVVPSALTSATAVTCLAVDSVDPDEWPEAVIYSVVWQKNGQTISVGAELDAAFVTKGAQLTCVASASDGNAFSSPVLAQVTVANSPPTITAATIIGANGAPHPAASLTCDATVSDPDPFDSLTRTAHWWVDGVLLGTTAATLPASAFTGCQRVRCDAHVSDGTASVVASAAEITLPPGDDCGMDPCTTWSCGANGCVGSPATGACEDGNPCTKTGTCTSGECVAQPVEPSFCDTGNPCANESCVDGVGCVSEPVSGSCDDGSVCTAVDECFAGACVGGAPIDCVDGVTCTSDECDPTAGCVSGYDPGAVGFPITLVHHDNVSLEYAVDDDLELHQGGQDGFHVWYALRMHLPAFVDWTPAVVNFSPVIAQPCCDGFVIGSINLLNYNMNRQPSGEYLSETLPTVLNQSAADIVPYTACMSFEVTVMSEDGSTVVATSRFRHSPTLVYEN